MNLTHEASRHGASEEFIQFLKNGRGTTAHKWAKSASSSGNWSISSANAFTKTLFMGDTRGAWSHTIRSDEERLLKDLFGVCPV